MQTKNLLPLITLCFILTNCNNSNSTSTEVTESDTHVFIDSVNVEESNESEFLPEEELDPVVGSYKCNKTGDQMVFYSDETGQFISGEGGYHEFTWHRYKENVTITYGNRGSDRLTFNEDAHTLSLKTALYGTLIFQ